MTSQRKAAYLEAMGIPVWVDRGVPPGQPVAANKSGNTLQVAMCDSSDNGSHWLWVIADDLLLENSLLADIRRAVGETNGSNICHPVEAGGQGLDVIVKQHMVTRIVLFGEDLDPGKAVHDTSCEIVQAPTLQALADAPVTKKQLWQTLQQLLDHQRQ